jgi:glycosyltransferase involved in cell wall biosynthesis
MDLYPDVAEDLGYLKRGSFLARLTGWLADASRRSSDGVVALGECMRTRLIERGIPAEKIFVADNWADSRAIGPVGFPATQPLTVLYSGNLGLAHDASTIAGAIDRLQASSPVKFRFSGGGTRQAWLRRQCAAHRWSGVEFSDYKSKDAFAASLGGAHIGLVTQLAECCGSVVPSKIYSIMAAGRPILFIGPKNSTAARIIRTFGCGWHVDNGQTDDVACLLEFLSRNPELVRLAGERAHQAFLARFDRPIGLLRLCTILGVTADASAYRVEREPLPGLLET